MPVNITVKAELINTGEISKSYFKKGLIVYAANMSYHSDCFCRYPLYITEVPKMLGKKYYRELAAYSVLLLLGTVIAVMKIFSINIPNVSTVLKGIFTAKNILNWLTES